jgi:hypothetical protein
MAPAGCTGTPELCNGIDDDCDGVVDNGFNLQTDPFNCGACGIVCSAPTATTACVAGQCVISSCTPGYVDADKNPVNGCECMVTNGARRSATGPTTTAMGSSTTASTCRTTEELRRVRGGMRAANAIRSARNGAVRVCLQARLLRRRQEGQRRLRIRVQTHRESRRGLRRHRQRLQRTHRRRRSRLWSTRPRIEPATAARPVRARPGLPRVWPANWSVWAPDRRPKKCATVATTTATASSTRATPIWARPATLPWRRWLRCRHGRLQGRVQARRLCLHQRQLGVRRHGHAQGGNLRRQGQRLRRRRSTTASTPRPIRTTAAAAVTSAALRTGSRCACQGVCVFDPKSGQGACADGWVDANHDPSDGCEYLHPDGGPEVCDGKDNDCNGLVDTADPGLVFPSNFCLQAGECGKAQVAPRIPAGRALLLIRFARFRQARRRASAPSWICNYPATVQVSALGQMVAGNLVRRPRQRLQWRGGRCLRQAARHGVQRSPAPRWAPVVRKGTWRCQADKTLVAACDFTGVPPAASPTDEICDGIDNDCDGLVDESWDNPPGLGQCSWPRLSRRARRRWCT